MPELPEVETVRSGLAQHITGALVARVNVIRSDLRQPVPKNFATEIQGRRIQKIARRAKYLLLHLDNESVIIIHLGMSGRLIVRSAGSYSPQKHDHLIFTLADGREIIFNDARRFGLVSVAKEAELEQHGYFSHLGPEPFSPEFSAAYLEEKLAARRGPIKPVLMDQALVVGVGNIYACEALFRVGLHPAMPAHTCVNRAADLVLAVQNVLREAIDSGGSTLRNYARASGESGYFQHKFQVYGREHKPCHVCGSGIMRLVQAGRSTFFCPCCQKASGESA